MPRLRFVSNVQGVSTIELNEPLVTVGRVVNNVVCIEDPNISKHHTLLVSEDDTYKIYDLHSVNGTWVNGERITVTRLKDGDAVRIGYLELKYEIGTPIVAPLAAAPAAKTATGDTPLAVRPRIGLKLPTPPAPVVAPVAPDPVVTPAPAPVKGEKRAMIQLPPDKKPVGVLPPPLPPAAAAPTPGLGGGPKLKPLAPPPPPPAPPSETKSSPAETPVPPAATSETPPPPPGPRRLGAAPGGAPPKFKLKRE